MNCNHCGATLNEGATFCQNCGQAVTGAAQPPYQQQPPMQQPYQQQPYQQQPYQQQPYPPQGQPTVKAGAYLTWAIITTVLCCWPFGIPAIVNASRINKCNEAGDFAGAEAAAKKSKTWTIVAACVGFVLSIGYVVGYTVAN